MAGARAAISAAGLGKSALTVIETAKLDVASGRATGEVLAQMPVRTRPTAVFCANDLLALGLLQDTTRRRLSVPRDLAIVGYDDIEFAAAAAVPLTSIRQPREDLGLAAMELLLEEAAELPLRSAPVSLRSPDAHPARPARHRHRQIVFEPELVVRESTQP